MRARLRKGPSKGPLDPPRTSSSGPSPSTLTRLLIATLALVAATAGAAVTKTFRQTTAKDFEEGEATASMILPDGAVVPGMKPSPVALEAAFVWCSTLSPDGRTAYFGTGDEGRIYAIDVAVNEARARRVAALDAPWITALATRPDGTLVVGTTPGGRVYTVDPKSGVTRLLATLGVDHVWALVVDGRTGAVYAGTGGPGKIFAIDSNGPNGSNGKSHEIWSSGDKHVVSLIQADATHLYAGTSEEAILFRVGLDGKAEALADFDAEEVRALGRSGGSLFAAVNDFDHTTPAPAVAPPGPHGTKITVAPSGSPASAGALPRPGQRKAKAALYRIDPDGHLEQVFSIGDGYFTSLAFDDEGRAFVGSGTEGRVYRVDPDRKAALAIDLPERQALTLVRSGKTFLVGTGDVGGVYRVVAAASRQATYLSRVLDAEFRARFGLLRWHGAHGLGLETRSGNTARPDPTWSAFAGLDRTRATAEGGAGLVASPSARYVQYRVTFGAADARLDAVTLAYLAQNQRPRITELTVGDSATLVAIGSPGGLGGIPLSFPASPSLSSTSTSASARVHSPLVKLRWKVENPDGDELDYRVTFRQENEAIWRPLGGPDPLSKNEFDWNTEGLPDGSYLVRVVASDERSEARDRALQASFTSAPILVDNRKPEVVGLVAKYPFISGRARDDQSPLTGLEYAIDGGDWQILSVTDGICDDLVESFTVKLPSLALGPHAVTVRAWDSADNVGAAAVTVTVSSKGKGAAR